MPQSTIGKLDIIPKDSLDIEWRIENFLSCMDTFYTSPTFSFAGASWCFNIYPNGDDDTDYETVEHISLYLFRNSKRGAINLEFSFGLKEANGEKYDERHVAHVFTRKRRSFGLPFFVSRSEICDRELGLLPSNALTVFCSVKFLKSTQAKVESTVCTSGSSVARYESKVLSSELGDVSTFGSIISPNDSKVFHDFKDLFLKKEDCDVLIKVQGEEFPAHKTILKARSSVFTSTFRSDMKEKATGVLEIEDCDPSSFSDFLCFLYCGEVLNLSKENVFSLFFTADKYDVQDLRMKCVDFMKQNLSVDTFCDTISLALRHSETELIKLTTDFFIKNAPNIVLTVKWQSFLAENPTESNELFVKLLIPNCSNSSK